MRQVTLFTWLTGRHVDIGWMRLENKKSISRWSINICTGSSQIYKVEEEMEALTTNKTDQEIDTGWDLEYKQHNIIRLTHRQKYTTFASMDMMIRFYPLQIKSQKMFKRSGNRN